MNIMAHLSKKRTSVTANNDIWRYQTVNNIKILANFSDVPRFISGIGRPWKIEKYPGGKKFIQNFCDSIQDWRDTHLDGFEYVNDNEDLCYFLLLTKPCHDGRSTEVIFTHHTLSKSFSNSSDSREVSVEAHNTSAWLKQRACNELNLPSQDTQKLMSKFTNYPTIHVSKSPIYSGFNEKTLNAQVVKHIIQESSPSASSQGWRYVLMNKTKHNKSFLENIPEIEEYSQHCISAAQFFENLESEIQNVKSPWHASYPFLHQNGLCALTILIHPVNGNIIELVCRFQTVNEQSS